MTPELLDALEQIAAESLRAAEIIRRLRQFVRKEAPRREWVQLNDLVIDVVRLVEYQATEQTVAVQLDLDPDLPAVSVDRIQIEQVILNLVRNGLEAMPTQNGGKRELTIATSGDALTVAVRVRDTGVGLEAESAHLIFEPFFTTKASGLGMGLSISRSIIEAHGGRLWASPAELRGTIVHFALPIDRPEATYAI